MQIQALEPLQELREELHGAFQKEVGPAEKDAGEMRRVAMQSSFPGESQKLVQMFDKVSKAYSRLEDAQHELEGIETESIEERLEEYLEKSRQDGFDDYEDEEIEKSTETATALENTLKTLEGEETGFRLDSGAELPDEDRFNRKDIASRILAAAGMMADAVHELKTQDKPDIDEEGYVKLAEVAETIDSERMDKLESAERIEKCLRKAEARIEELEDESEEEED
jgi:hypothetical protein